MAGILGPIDVTAAHRPTATTLAFHDENDTTAHTWTLQQRRPAWNTASRRAERRNRDDHLSAKRPVAAGPTINGGFWR